MDDNDHLAYEAAMATLQDAREDCLRSLDDEEPVAPRRRRPWWSLFAARPTLQRRSLAC